MARDTTDFRPIERVDELAAYLAEGNKPREKWRIGTEHEKFPFYVDGNAPVPYGGDARHPRAARGHAADAGLGPDPRPGQHHRPRRADRPGRDLARARRPVRAVRRAARDDPPDLPRGQCASGAAARDRRAARHPLPRPRRQPEMDARRNAEDAEIALRDHDALHAEGRHQGPRHDVPHLHDPGESRLLVAKPTCAARCRCR